MILPCTLCDMDKVNCSKCPLEDDKNKKEVEDIGDKIDLNRMANILASEAEMLHCTLTEAWNGIAKSVTSQFNFKEVESLVIKLNSQQ